MQEQVLTISEGLKKGLRPDSRSPRNTEFFTSVKNILCTPFGAKKYTLKSEQGAYTNPLLGDGTPTSYPDFDFPFPQVFIGKEVVLLADKTAIYQLTMPGAGFTGNVVGTDELAIYKVLDDTSAFTIPTSGEPWHFVDMGDAWTLIRPNCVVTLNKVRSTTTGGGTPDKILGQSTSDATYVVMRTGCEFKGRTIIGGFDPSHFWSADWKYIWRSWAHQIGMPINIDFADVNTNWVMWTSIGGGDTSFIFKDSYAYNPAGVMASYPEQTSPAEPILFEYLKAGQIGMAPMPWSGTVDVVKPLGDLVMVYGSNGVSALRPATEPFPTFGIIPIFRQNGILGRGAVCGNDSFHLFIDEAKNLWRITADLKVEKLYDNTAFSSSPAAVDADALMFFDEIEQYAYICDDDGTFILTESGLSWVDQYISALFWWNGYQYAAQSTSGYNNDIEMITDIIDMGARSMKQIMWVEVGADLASGGDVSVTIQYRYDNVSSFSSSTTMKCNNEGVAFMSVAGIDFKIKITSTDHTKVNSIDYIKVGWANVDKRYQRGVH